MISVEKEETPQYALEMSFMAASEKPVLIMTHCVLNCSSDEQHCVAKAFQIAFIVQSC